MLTHPHLFSKLSEKIDPRRAFGHDFENAIGIDLKEIFPAIGDKITSPAE